MNLGPHDNIHAYIDRLIRQGAPTSYNTLNVYKKLITAVHVVDDTYDLVIGDILNGIKLIGPSYAKTTEFDISYIIRQILLHFNIRTLVAPSTNVNIICNVEDGCATYRLPERVNCLSFYAVFTCEPTFILPPFIDCRYLYYSATSDNELRHAIQWLHDNKIEITTDMLIPGILYSNMRIDIDELTRLIIEYDIASSVKDTVVIGGINTPAYKLTRRYIDALNVGKEQTGLELDI